MDVDKDGFIDPQRMGIEELKLNIRRQFESVWFNIILKRDLVNRE